MSLIILSEAKDFNDTVRQRNCERSQGLLLSTKQKKIYFFCLAVAILLHALVYQCFRVHPGIPRGATQNVTQIKIVAMPRARPLTPPQVGPKRGTSKSIPRPIAANPPQYPVGRPGYLKLLPPADWAFRAGDEQSTQAPVGGQDILGEKLGPGVQAHGAVLASEIDIPLHWRRNAKASVAVLDFVIRDGEIWCRLLSGEPMLRAALWKFLQKPQVYATLVDILRSGGQKDYKIRLKFVPEIAPDRTVNLAEDSVAYSKGIEIIKMLPQAMKEYGGMAVPEEAHKKAIARDRLALSELYESPAFKHQVRDVKIGKM